MYKNEQIIVFILMKFTSNYFLILELKKLNRCLHDQQFQQRLILIESRTIQVGNYKPYTIQANQSLLSYFGLIREIIHHFH